MFPSMPPPPGIPTKDRGERLRRRKQASTANQSPLYIPSIYSYTCRGKYFASSDKKGGEEGICKGLKSKLEMLYDNNQETVTRAEALKRFTTMTADFDLDFEDGAAASNSELHQQAKSVLISPALIYKDPEATKRNENDPLHKDQLVPEEELIVHQDWTCYGSTDVEYLVLQDVNTGAKKIAAVAPRTTGISFREIETDDSLRSIVRVGLGWLDIIHDNHSVLVDDDEDHHKDSQNNVMPNVEEVPPKPQVDTLDTAKRSLAKTFDFSCKVAQQMKYNLQWLGNNLQDDFPARTYAAGQKIVAQIPKTVDLTVDFMGKLVKRWTGDDFDDDDNNGRRRGA